MKDSDKENNESIIIKTLKCPSCGASLPLNNVQIIDSDTIKKSINCEFCGSTIPISDEIVNVINNNRHFEKKYSELFSFLNKHFKKPFSDSTFKALNIIPYLLFTFQLAIIIIVAFSPTSKSFLVDNMIYDWFLKNYNFAFFLTLPSFIISTIIIFITRKNSFSDTELLFSFFRPKPIDNRLYSCRNCGNTIKSTKIPEFIICPYCKTHNVIYPSNKRFKKIADNLKIKLDEIQNLSKLFDKKIKKYTSGLTIGFIILYGVFFTYAMFFEHLDSIDWASKFIILPSITYILLNLFNSIAMVPYSYSEKAIPSNYLKDNVNETAMPLKTKIYTISFKITKIIIWILFFIAMFNLNNV